MTLQRTIEKSLAKSTKRWIGLLARAGYTVHVLSDCTTSYDKKKLPEMLEYYAQKGCAVQQLREVI